MLDQIVTAHLRGEHTEPQTIVCPFCSGAVASITVRTICVGSFFEDWHLAKPPASMQQFTTDSWIHLDSVVAAFDEAYPTTSDHQAEEITLRSVTLWDEHGVEIITLTADV